MKLGVYVGSFNPVHKGHKFVVDYLISNKFVDKILIIPTENYWDKNNLIETKHRMNMLKFYENENVMVSDKYSSFECTNEILALLSKTTKDTELYLIIGADNLLKFEKWEKVDSLLKHKVLVLERDDIDMNKQIQKFSKEQQEHFVLVEKFPCVGISSTEIRKYIAENNFDKLKELVDEEILEYIVENGLYK